MNEELVTAYTVAVTALAEFSANATDAERSAAAQVAQLLCDLSNDIADDGTVAERVMSIIHADTGVDEISAFLSNF